MMINSKTMGAAIRAARRCANWTQRQLATKAGTGLRFVIEAEQGKPSCQIAKVFALLDALDIEIVLNPMPAEVANPLPGRLRRRRKAALPPPAPTAAAAANVRDRFMEGGLID